MFRHIHKNIALYCLIGIVTLILACGSSSGGGDDGGGQKPLATGTFVKTVENGLTISSNLPFKSGVAGYTQLLLFPEDINGSGNVSALSFKFGSDNAAAVACTNMQIKMGHTDLDALTFNYSSNVEQGRGSLVTVFDGTLNIPAGSAGDYFTIALSAPFNYNGVDNVVVQFAMSGSCDTDVGIIYDNVTYTDVMFHRDDVAMAKSLLLPYYPYIKFKFSGGDNTIDYNTASTAVTGPFNTVFQKVLQIYNAAEIDGSGPITGVAVSPSAVTTNQQYTVTVKIGHTSLDVVTTNFADNFNVGSPVTVANAVTIDVPAGIPVGDYFWIPMPDGIFNYNGTDNLAIEISVSDASGLIPLAAHTLVTGGTLYGEVVDTSGGVSNISDFIKFRFNGGTMDVITPGDVLVPPPFNTTISRKEQLLVDATSLGTGGSITKVAFRLVDATSTANDYSNFEVILGETSSNTLGLTYASNFDRSVTVRPAATFSLPAGLIEGDWIEVPLSTPFNYDPTKNLVIQATTDDTGINANNVRGTSDGTRYLDHAIGSIDPNGVTADPPLQPIMLDLRLWISK